MGGPDRDDFLRDQTHLGIDSDRTGLRTHLTLPLVRGRFSGTCAGQAGARVKQKHADTQSEKRDSGINSIKHGSPHTPVHHKRKTADLEP